MTIVEKRKAIEKKVLGYMKTIEPEGTNAKRYEEIFKSMNDAQFKKFMDNFLPEENEDDQFYVEYTEYENSPTMDNIKKGALFLGIPLFEYVFMPYKNNNLEEPMCTPRAVLVGYTPEKRVQQRIEKKNSTSVHSSQVNPMTGQVVHADKNGRMSDVETFAILTRGANKIMAEMHGARADDPVAKAAMLGQIAQNGYCTLETLPKDPLNKIALNTWDSLFVAMGIGSDLVTPGYILPMTIKK